MIILILPAIASSTDCISLSTTETLVIWEIRTTIWTITIIIAAAV